MNFQSLSYNIQFFFFEKKGPVLSFSLFRNGYLLFKLFQHWYAKFLSKNYYTALSALLSYERDIVRLVGQENVVTVYRSLYADFLKQHITQFPEIMLSLRIYNHQKQ